MMLLPPALQEERPMTMRFAEAAHTVNSPDIVAEDFDGQIVILNLASGHYYSLDGIAGKIWGMIVSGHGLGAIISSIAANRPELAEDGAAFIHQLLALGLIRPDPSRDLAADMAGDWSGGPPRLDTYDDLAELIAADPIHDVDEEIGWPATRKAP
jgi:hypothetical protein